MLTSPWYLSFLFFTGAAAGLVDSIAGGGGLITIPVMLGLGIPPQITLGTNKLQASFGSFTAAYHYVRHGVVDLRDAVPGIIATLIGAAIGAYAVQQIHNDILAALIPFLLAAIILYTLLTPALGKIRSAPKWPRLFFYAVAGTALGFYDGFFGPGVGSFWAFAFVLLLGFDLKRATGYTKVMNFTSNGVALGLFLAGGAVWFGIGLIMAAGQIVGSIIGARLVIRKGSRFVRPVFVAIVTLTTLKLLVDRLL